MKFFRIVFLLIILLLTSLAGLFYAINFGYMDNQIRKIAKHYLKQQGVELLAEDFKFKNGVLHSKNLAFKTGEGVTQLYDFEMNFGLVQNGVNPQIQIEIKPVKVKIFNEKDEIIAESEITGNIMQELWGSDKQRYFRAQDIKVLGRFKNAEGKLLDIGQAYYRHNISKGENDLDAEISFGESSYFKVHGGIAKDEKLQISLSNLPIRFYKIASRIYPKDPLVIFLQKFIRNGFIETGEFELLNAELSGEAKIHKMELSYSPKFPSLKQMDVNVVVKNNKARFLVNQAYSTDIKLYEGSIDMDWKGVDDTILFIKAKAKGAARGLADFISAEQHAAMHKANIDLRKIKGNVSLDVYVEIPLKKNTKNKYDIRAEIPNTSLSVFNNYVNLTAAKMSGSFDGDRVVLEGAGKINSFNSHLDFVYNVADETEFGHKLDIKTHLKTTSKKPGRHTKLAFFSLLGGDSIIDINYTNKAGKGYIKMNSDISDLDLYFDKLGIRKAQNETARLVLNGIFDDPDTGTLKFDLNGENNLNVLGKAFFDEGRCSVDISEIKHKETNLSAQLQFYQGLFSADIKGATLDLADADMLQFLEKERDGGSTKLSLDVGRVGLYHDIWLDNLKLDLECDPVRCYSGFIDAKLGNRTIDMQLSASGEKENWVIKTTNAGALLKGLGTYDAMKAGTLTLNIETSRKEVHSGEIIPILQGDFHFERFKLSNTPAMSRLVSFVSLPGFISFISGNKDIVFANMEGEFSFVDNVLTVKKSAAEGPFFGFTLKGNIDVKNRYIDVEGHVKPALYGVSSVISNIPLFGPIITGTKESGGLVSAAYQFKESY